MIGYDEVVKEFKPGRVYYEDVYGDRVEFLVISKPVAENGQVTWEAINNEGFKTYFLITKGLEHYGPKLYWESN